MSKKNRFWLNLPIPNTEVALFVIAVTQIPVAIKNAAEVACMVQA